MGPLPAMDTHTKLEAVDIKELQEEEKPNFSGKSLPKKKIKTKNKQTKKNQTHPKNIHYTSTRFPHPIPGKTKQNKKKIKLKKNAQQIDIILKIFKE